MAGSNLFLKAAVLLVDFLEETLLWLENRQVRIKELEKSCECVKELSLGATRNSVEEDIVLCEECVLCNLVVSVKCPGDKFLFELFECLVVIGVVFVLW